MTHPKGYCVITRLVLKHYAPSQAIIRNKIESNRNFNLDILQLVLFQIVKPSPSPDVVFWRALHRLLNKLRHNLHHIGYFAYLRQRLTWRPTIALSTFDLINKM